MNEYKMRTRIKICGITNVEDAELAIRLGADAIGIIFHPASPRFVDLNEAQQIRKIVPAFVDLVGVFVNLGAEEIQRINGKVGLDLVQLHGDESPDFAESLGLPYIKALSAEHSMGLNASDLGYASARAFLLDSRTEQSYGGTGRAFDKTAWPSSSQTPLILAGGLGPEYLRVPVRQLNPYAVDLNSGVELEPGKKDPAKLVVSFEHVRDANSNSKMS